jgi:hypothetical protein
MGASFRMCLRFPNLKHDVVVFQAEFAQKTIPEVYVPQRHRSAEVLKDSVAPG